MEPEKNLSNTTLSDHQIEENVESEEEEEIEATDEILAKIKRDTIREELEKLNFKEIIKEDFLDATINTTNMVDTAKTNLSCLINFRKKKNSKSDTTRTDNETASTRTSGIQIDPALNGLQGNENEVDEEPGTPVPTSRRVSTERIIKYTVKELKKKAKIDLQVVQLYDKALVHEIRDQIKKDVFDKSISNLKEKATEDFQATQDNTDTMVEDTKLTIENFINSIRKTISKDEDNVDENMLWKKIKQKIRDDFENTNDKTQNLTNKAISLIRENMDIFFVNPAGKKPLEELESEQFVKESLLNITDTVKKDIQTEKVSLSRTVEETKSKVGFGLLYPKSADTNIESNETNLQLLRENLAKLHQQTKDDFKEMNEKVQEEVVTVKETIDLPKENRNGEAPDILIQLTDTAQADFNEANMRIQENVTDLKEILQGVTVKENSETSEREQELIKVVEKGLSELQDKAKIDFKDTNEKVTDNVVIAKSKIDESVNKLKDKFFFKIP